MYTPSFIPDQCTLLKEDINLVVVHSLLQSIQCALEKVDDVVVNQNVKEVEGLCALRVCVCVCVDVCVHVCMCVYMMCACWKVNIYTST